jgi:hypothetical protein
MALGSTQILTEMSTRNLHGSKGWSTRKTDNLNAIYEPMWEPRRLITLWAFTACYRDNFTFFLPFLFYMQTHYISHEHMCDSGPKQNGYIVVMVFPGM